MSTWREWIGLNVPDNNGRLRWQFTLEWVIIPLTGLGLTVIGALTGWINAAWAPIIVGFVAFPFARTIDRLRRSD